MRLQTNRPNCSLTLIVESCSTKLWVTSVGSFQKYTRSKQSPIRRKIAQSGHRGYKMEFLGGWVGKRSYD
jgi:hypothetical protein